jgi:hypothetical protein
MVPHGGAYYRVSTGKQANMDGVRCAAGGPRARCVARVVVRTALLHTSHASSLPGLL